MSVTHFFFEGTKEEVDALQSVLPMTKGDRVLENRLIFDHMCKHLEVDIYTLMISKRCITPTFIQIIKIWAEKYPKTVWFAQMLSGMTPEYKGELLSNWHQTNTPDHPGPFGSLCIRYGKSYW